MCGLRRIGGMAVGMLMANLLATAMFTAEKTEGSPGGKGERVGRKESAGTPATALPADLVNYTEKIPGTDLSFEMIAFLGGAF
jgi:hypothetical protein